MNRNDRSIDGTSLAVDVFRRRSGTDDSGLPREPRTGSLLVVAQRLTQILRPVPVAPEPRALRRSVDPICPQRRRGDSAISYTMEQLAQPLFRDVTPLAAPTHATNDWIPLAILGMWLCGFVATVLMRFRNWLRIRAIVRASATINIPVPDLPAPVEVRSSPGIMEPGVVGLIRPILLLPEGIAARLTPSELEAVLAHEFCHVRRRDNLFASIHMLVEAVFWFHPLVWWIGARLVEERERACDEEVLTVGNRPDVYADAILNVCKIYVESPLPCVSGVTGAGIGRRIEAIMARSEERRVGKECRP